MMIVSVPSHSGSLCTGPVDDLVPGQGRSSIAHLPRHQEMLTTAEEDTQMYAQI